MRDAKPVDRLEKRFRWMEITPDQQPIADRVVVQCVRNRLDLPDAIEGVADQKARADLRVEERPDAEMISCSENRTLLCIPDDEGEVTKQVFDAGLAPTIVSQEN